MMVDRNAYIKPAMNSLFRKPFNTAVFIDVELSFQYILIKAKTMKYNPIYKMTLNNDDNLLERFRNRNKLRIQRD